jgi:hypothetical protein
LRQAGDGAAAVLTRSCWADDVHDAHTIVIASFRCGVKRLENDAEIFVRPAGDVESGQDHVHDEEGWLWL